MMKLKAFCSFMFENLVKQRAQDHLIFIKSSKLLLSSMYRESSTTRIAFCVYPLTLLRFHPIFCRDFFFFRGGNEQCVFDRVILKKHKTDLKEYAFKSGYMHLLDGK